MKSVPMLLISLLAASPGISQWPQFAGPHRNFTSDAKGLAGVWPASGPKRLWSRDLGEGYSGIAVDGAVLYTMYRKGTQEVAVSLDARTGKTLWEHAYDAPFRSNMRMENGAGPHATPLVTATHVYTVGILAHLYCFDKESGKVVWFRDLYKDFPNSTKMGRGYSGSPLAYKNTIILTIGGENNAVIVLDPRTGALVWAKNSFQNSPSSAALIQVDGRDQMVAFLDEGGSGNASGMVAGLDPNNGEVLWTHPHKTDWGLNIALPVSADGNIVLVSSAYSGGTRALELTRQDGKYAAKELWYNRRMRVHHGSMVRVGDYAYGSSGDFGPAPLTAINVRTGEIKWQDRTFSKANFIYADGKFIVLDEDGNLALAKFAPEGLTVISKISLLTHNAWTAPSLAGTKLYVRDRRSIVALDLN